MATCPACKNTMSGVMISGVEIDFCKEGCKGVWFDNYELVKLDEVHEGSVEELKEILSAERSDDTRVKKLICPRCQIAMKRRRYRYGTDVEIDNCYNCNGIFLDAGELQNIRQNFNQIQAKSQQFVSDFGDELSKQKTSEPIRGNRADHAEKAVGILSGLFGGL